MSEEGRRKLERRLRTLHDRRRVLDREIWAVEQELAGLPLPQPEHRRRATDRAELATA
jgi:hypothetical protein